ncbi:long-chain-fatty-acid--CoA ligase [Streptomyces sp. DASNCL29]|uniref:long-chain-fatty-acid--CoA ligase n=1 Tax=Streptomyces sp. DASNCL29 TaxID=2583819 RepID=UPI00110FA943|nr:long-chain-fatty-acid--CoA ligase [Streptomyces sp. DASNCL29]TMU98593.1 long-chain-fatty-acid--CoA ligase [Streptomyces sp. DASNCL29]
MTRTPTLTLGDVAAHHAAQRPDHTAIHCQGRRMSYGELHCESNRTAHALRAHRATAGSRIGYLGRESEHYYTLALGCAKSESVLVPVNWRLTATEVDHILRDSGVEILFVEDEFMSTAADVAPQLPKLRTVVRLDDGGAPGDGFRTWQAGHPDDDLVLRSDRNTPVIQLYTSGTSGLPKGVVLGHRTFFAFTEEMRRLGEAWIDWRPDDVSLISFPGFHTAGMGWFMHGFTAGATNVIMRIFVSEEAVRLIRELGVTTTFIAPAMLQMLLDEPGVDRETFRTLRKVAYGAAPIPTALLERCLDVMGCEFAQIYASTETGSVAACLPPADHKPGSSLLASAGRACPGNELKIIDRDGHPLPAGEIGQVCVRTPTSLLEYWQLPQATQELMVDGWLLMGDAGYLDEDGYLYLCDRVNDTIIVAGQNIYPAEVEKALAEHPAVADVAVIGVPDERWGEAVQACVALRPGREATPRELMISLRGRVADFKIPTRYIFIDHVPRNPSGKLLRRQLRDGYQQQA